jgi:hypothetical protein
MLCSDQAASQSLGDLLHHCLLPLLQRPPAELASVHRLRPQSSDGEQKNIMASLHTLTQFFAQLQLQIVRRVLPVFLHAHQKEAIEPHQQPGFVQHGLATCHKVRLALHCLFHVTWIVCVISKCQRCRHLCRHASHGCSVWPPST